MWRPRLRTILLLVNVVILCLPLGGIALLRIYESALIRQTESELVAQGAFVAASYRAAFDRIVTGFGATPAQLTGYGLPVTARWAHLQDTREPWRPRPATLDLATDIIRPPRPEPVLPTHPGDWLATLIGREITPVLRDAQVVTLAAIRVVDYRGTVVASTGGDFGLSMITSEEVVRALEGEYVSLLRKRILDQPPPPLASISRGTRIRVYVAMPIVMNNRTLGAVVLSRTPSNITRALYGKRYPLLYGALALLTVVLLMSVFTSLTISRPVRALIGQAERAVRGETGAVTPLTAPVTREIAQLSASVAAMAQTLEQRADYIRTFAAHVSHEFKTPLTAIQGAVELLRDHADSMSEHERRRFLDNLHEDAGRLERLVRRLLDLARADVMKIGAETAEIGRVVERLVKRYTRTGPAITVVREHDTPLKAAIAEDTLDAVLANLIDNARQHAGETVAVTLRIGLVDTGRGRPRAEILVADDGPGISRANAARVFQPFFTTARKQGGTGLGLAIVKALLAAHHGEIELLADTPGTTFRIGLALVEHGL